MSFLVGRTEIVVFLIVADVLKHLVFISPRKLNVLEETARTISESTGNEVG